jgi:hypothetical protein
VSDPCETFPALDALPGIRAAFIARIPGIDVATDRETALARLSERHASLANSMGFGSPALAEQVHGNRVAVVEAAGDRPAPGADALVSATPGLTLGIYVADCAAIYVVDPLRRAIALAHSGRKGSELNILGNAIEALQIRFGSAPEDLVVVVSPCIRPPHYEIDFAALIAAQARAAGVGAFHDAGVCTASNPERYYSYRRELGKTGRMLALLSISA